MHNHTHNHESKNLKIAAGINLLFSAIEFIAGAFFNSATIMADAVHDLGDALVLTISLIFNKIAGKQANSKYSYGYRRIAVIGAIINSVVILMGSYSIIKWVFREFFVQHTHPHVHVAGLFWVSVIGVVVNLIAMYKLRGSKNILNKTVLIHMLEDLLGWIFSLCTSIMIYLTDMHILDRVASIAILVLVGGNAVLNLYKIIKILMQSTPNMKDLDKIKKDILKLDNVVEINKIHFWTLDGENHVFTANIVIKKLKNIENIRSEISEILNKYHIIDETIEFSVNKNI